MYVKELQTSLLVTDDCITGPLKVSKKIHVFCILALKQNIFLPVFVKGLIFCNEIFVEMLTFK